MPLITNEWANSIGFSVYAFEGIGIILPVKQITSEPQNYFRILCCTLFAIAVIYIGYAVICVYGFGFETLNQFPLITQVALPSQSWISYTVKILFSLNLVFSYPLVINPTNNVIETYLFGSWKKSRSRQMSKNVSRTVVIAASCILALVVYNKLTEFLSITGALTCTPIAFTLPAIFHYKMCAVTTCQKVTDLIIFGVSLVIMVYCTSVAVINF